MSTFNREVGLGLDNQKLISRTLGILPHRDRYFMDMIKCLKIKYPGIRIVYANSTPGQTLNPEHPTPDFILILRATLVSNDPKLPSKKIIMFDMPLIFTDRSIAGWTLSVEAGNKDGYFQYMMDKMCRIPENRFVEYLNHMALLSLRPESELYWKDPKNQDTLVRELMELYSRYAKKEDGNKLKAVSGYGPKNPQV